ncbi:MAG TPA: NirD/YgiW/YdeI family stress tolerance protein, partial [Candidimonas sp.]|nr:NirD/YgiW/YdeI family stress tolerance protein [Candidimonas sp.]
RKQGHEKYIFTDGTGEIVAEIDDKDFPTQQVNEKTKIEIVGEVDTGLRRPPEIEVDTMRIIN